MLTLGSFKDALSDWLMQPEKSWKIRPRRWRWNNPALNFFTFPYRIHQKQVSWGRSSIHCLSFFVTG